MGMLRNPLPFIPYSGYDPTAGPSAGRAAAAAAGTSGDEELGAAALDPALALEAGDRAGPAARQRRRKENELASMAAPGAG